MTEKEAKKKAYQKKYKKENREKLNAKQREYNKKNAEKIADYQRKYIKENRERVKKVKAESHKAKNTLPKETEKVKKNWWMDGVV